MRQAHISLTPYCPSRRQETGGPEPMDLCYVESKRPRSSNNKRLQKCNRCQKLGHYAYECSASRPVPNSTERNDRPERIMGVGPTLLRSHNSVSGRQKTVGVSKGGCPTDPATSREFANLLTEVAPDTQPLCFSAPGDEVSLITLELKVTNDCHFVP